MHEYYATYRRYGVAYEYKCQCGLTTKKESEVIAHFESN